ncbi:filamin-A-like isoform X2 [Watersipora subatra]|uniref:filamin-A-like isoform X2 n=1 Tax=Watersipora subatra TaxID=2589382 RepID=UPI00355C19E8
MYTDGYDVKGDYYSAECEEDEMPATERELAEDAQWKVIQKNTFTRWTNEHLKQANKSIASLEYDLSDGLRLCALIEVLSGKKFKRINKRPNFRSQKLENVTTALKLLEEVEGIKIVNIDSTDIVDSKLKLILGLIWTLILHYSISMPMWEGEEDVPGSGSKEGPTPKQRLLVWVQNRLPEVPVKNFTTDWNDGKAIGALVDAVGPGLCPDWEDWDPKSGKRNATEAMDLAEQWLEVPQLIKPDEMVNPKIDELSMMTYLSQFPNAKLKAGAPLRPRTNAARVRAYGPGLEPEGVCALTPARFTVETFSAGRGEITVTVLNAEGHAEECEVVFNNDRNLTYSCSYTPSMEGVYTVSISFAGKEIPKSPYKVTVEGAAGDPEKVTAEGPGLQAGGVQAGKKTYFEVFTEGAIQGAGVGNVEVIIVDSRGHKDTCKARVSKSSETTYYVEYVAKEVGRYSVHIYFAGKEIPYSPYTVNIGAPVEPKKAYATGRGVQGKGVRIQDVADIMVHTAGAGSAEVSGKLIGPTGSGRRDSSSESSSDESEKGVEEPLRFKRIDEHTYETSYKPTKPGNYTVHLLYGTGHIAKSPFKVAVGPHKESKIRAYGPGLEGGIVGKPADFIVETNGETGALGFAIEGPSQAKIQCSDNGDGSADVTYQPTAPGEYAVHVLCDNEDIPNSPFMAMVAPGLPQGDSDMIVPEQAMTAESAPNGVYESPISPDAALKAHSMLPNGRYGSDFNPTEVVTSGPGLEKNGVVEGTPALFTVDTSKAGDAPLKVYGQDVNGKPINVQVKNDGDGRYNCSYHPKEPIKHTIFVTYGGVNVPNSPFRVYVEEPSKPDKVKVFGPGIEPGVTCNEGTHFFVDCTEAGPGDIAISLTDDKGMDVPVDADDNGEGLFRIEYVPETYGTYTVNVLFADQEIPTSPYTVKIEPSIDVSGVKVVGLEKDVFIDSSTDFLIDASSVTPDGEGKVRAVVTSPSGAKNDTKVTNNGDGTYRVAYAPYQEGPHEIDITYEGLPIPGSPLQVEVVPGNDPSRVKAYGPGLEKGVTHEPQEFTIETKGAGQGGLALAVEGPSKAQVNCVDNHDGTCSVDYTPTKPGDYDITVKFDGQNIPGSPFKAAIEDAIDPSKVRMYGPGLNPEGVRATLPAPFTIDCKEAGKAPLKATLDDGSGVPEPIELVEVDEGVFECTYVPKEKGAPCRLDVMYDDAHVPGSPFEQTVLPASDASEVKVSGPGIEDGVPASLPTEFSIDTSKAGLADLDVAIQAPDGRYLKPTITDNKDATVTVHYTPEDVGVYNAKVKYGGEPIPGSPFDVNTRPTGDASKCQITEGKKRVVVDEECVITVNTADAGLGNITCRIRTPKDTDADIDIVDNNDGKVSIFYTPHTPGSYGISIKFGGVPIPEGDYEVEAFPEEMMIDEADIVPLQKANSYSSAPSTNTYHPVDFVIPVGPIFAYVLAEVESPSGKRSPVKIKDNGDGTVTINYQPSEVGLHNLHVYYNDEPLEGSPYQFYVDEVNSPVVAAYGPGLSYGVASEPCSFTIDTKNSGAGGLSLAVEGPSKAEIVCQDNDDGTCTVTYLPTEPGLYNIVVKFDDEHIMGSPFTAYIAGEANKEKAQLSMGQASEFSLSVEEYDINELEADITTPTGKSEPCILKKLPNGHLGISFTPHETGTHLVNVYKDGQHIENSPFKINVTRNEVGSADKVKVYGDGLTSGVANEVNEFYVDTKDAGYGGLSLSIEGPSKADIDCKDRPDGSTAVNYKPTQPGNYCISIKFADEHVPGSPFNCKVGGMTGVNEESMLTTQQKAADITHVGSMCELSLKVPGSDPMEMVASVTSPSGITELCDVMDSSEDHYTIQFVPKEMGAHIVSVKHKGLSIPGSPFQFTVGPITEGGAHRVHANGPGLEKGEVDVRNEFNIYTREAGSGGLAISVEGPSKADIKFEDKHDGSSVVSYQCSDVGEYVVSVKFNDEHIPDSPFRVPVLPHSGDARKVTVQALRQRGLEIGKPASFTCQFNGAKGELFAKVVAPSGAEDEALCQSLDDSDSRYAVRFIPRENGVHFVHVTLDRNHIRGSPFKVIVGEQEPDPGVVTASGPGLKKAETGTNNKFTVHTVGAGSSSLVVTIDGPSKAKLDAKEIADGYEFTYNPSAPGTYFITIKYGGNHHIAGSPFKVKCTGAGQPGENQSAHCVIETNKKTEADLVDALPKFNSDGSKVTSKGPGLTKAFVNKKAQFTVDSSTAGVNMLFVGMIGPANSPPVDEILIKHAQRNTYNVSYTVKQKGKYHLLVKWGDDHIPGSPFHIDVV